MRFLSIVLALFSFFKVCGNTLPVFEFTDTISPESIQSYLYVYEDSESSLSIDSIKNIDFNLFSPIDLVKHKLKRNTSYWIALRIKNVYFEAKDLFFVAGLTRSIDLYYQHSYGEYIEKKYGYKLADTDKEYTEPVSQIVGLTLRAREEKLIYFNVESDLNLKPDPLFKIYEQRDYHKKIEQINLIQGVFHGLIWMLIAYIFFLYVNMRDKVYLYYIIYAASFSIAIFILMGYPRHYIFPDLKFHVLYSELIIQIGSIFYFLLFMEALDIKNHLPRSVRPLKCFIAFLAFGAIVTGIFLFIDLYIYNLLTQIFVFIELIVFCWFLAKLFHLKNPISIYILIGNMSIVIGALVIVVGLLFFKEPFLKYFPVFQAGVTLEVLFFAIGLSKRFQYSEEVKRLIQDKLILELKSKEVFQRRVNDELEEKVKERTQEINQSKEEIVQQQEYIEQKNKLLELYNKKLTANLEYAGFIQNALLLDFNKVKPFFRDSFLWHKPQSFVSGDFYMFFKLESGKAILLVADCTGHGVPGAMLTLIAQDFLNEIIIAKSIHNPAKILNELDKRIISRLLNVSTNENLHEGLDIGIVLIDKDANELLFSGAKMPMIQIKNNEIHKTRGDLFGIGGLSYKKTSKEFQNHKVAFSDDDVFYMYSDGFQDQLQAGTNKKYMSKRFTSLLLSLSGESMSQQRKTIQKDHIEWRGDADQTDDIIIVGFQV